ncbi:MAG: hypothetical protein HOD92_22965 [Deltaproteobacteria bacterium]|jgi:hypothetical protein|nr:hypothetical protein [Deltaproteobacteria bacterium]
MARTWNNEERAEQSRLTLERVPSSFSTGPRGKIGKDKVRRNSIKYGYFTESHREFRKGKRSPQARVIEKLIREICKTKDDSLRLDLINQVRQRLSEFCNELSPIAVLEATYLNSLVLVVVNKCIYSRVKEIVANIHEYSRNT